MDLSRFSKIIKILTIIPALIGVLIFVEIILPVDISTSIAKSKSDNYRLKTNSTTYTIIFEEIDDQFTEEIYNSVSEGDSVILETTPINKQISSLTLIKSGEKFLNDTGENIAIYGFGLVFILSGFSFLKKGKLSKKLSFYISLVIVISVVMGVRMI